MNILINERTVSRKKKLSAFNSNNICIVAFRMAYFWGKSCYIYYLVLTSCQETIQGSNWATPGHALALDRIKMVCFSSISYIPR